MAQRSIAVLTTLALTIIPAALAGAQAPLTFGCWTRPACGKVCKLVCDTTTLTVECYGAECEQICVPGRSAPGCKHCAACCGTCEPGLVCLPKCLFCWRDWCPCGCGQPRSVKKLTKYEAEKEICSYHWEVVDGCSCGCGCGQGCEPGCEPSCGGGCVYKPAPSGAQIGDTMEVTDQELAQVAVWKADSQNPSAVQQADAVSTASGEVTTSSPADAAGDRAAQTLRQQLTSLFRRGED